MADLPQLSVVGLGKLGQCFAAVFAAKGFTVVGVDRDERTVASLQKGKASVQEPGLQNLLDASGARLSTTHDAREAITRSDVTFMIVPTPSKPDGTFTTSYVEAALTTLAEHLRVSSKPYHLFVLNSTVMPGSADVVLIPLIERVSGRRVHEGFGFCYSPAFIAARATSSRRLTRPRPGRDRPERRAGRKPRAESDLPPDVRE